MRSTIVMLACTWGSSAWPSPPLQYAELGTLEAREYGAIYTGGQLAYGLDITGTPLWLRGGIAFLTGAKSGVRYGAGLEVRGCDVRNSRVCVAAGLDVDWLDLSCSGTGSCETDSADVHDIVAVARVGVDLGKQSLRFRPGLELVFDRGGMEGGSLTAAVAWQWPPPGNEGSVVRFEPSTSAKNWLGVQLEAVPKGTIEVMANSTRTDSPTELAYGVGGSFERWLTPNVAIGVAPRLVTPVQLKGVSGNGHELDLRARLAVGGELVRGVFFHVIATGGYAWIFDAVDEVDPTTHAIRSHTTSGAIGGGGARLSYALHPRLLLVSELAYQWGEQGSARASTSPPLDVSVSDRFLTLGFGVAQALD